MTLDPRVRRRHNDAQRRHFARRPESNPRMQPVDSPYVDRHLDRLLRLADINLQDRILDVGCGMGKFTLPLMRRGYQVEGLDLSPAQIERLAARLPEGADVALHCHDLLDVPVDLVGRFDVVTGFFMLHHLLDLEAAFRALHSYLRPGGKVAFLEPNALNPLYYLQITLTPGMSWKADKGVLSMTRGRLLRALRDSGYSDVLVERSGMFPPAVVNRPWGRRAEDVIGRFAPLEPVSAFQVVTAVSPGPAPGGPVEGPARRVS